MSRKKFDILSMGEIESYIDSLYDPYKIFGNTDEILDDHLRFDYKAVGYQGLVKTVVRREIKKEGEIFNVSYVIFNPKQNEIEKKKAFIEIDIALSELCDLKILQTKHKEKGLSKIEEAKIDKFYNKYLCKKESSSLTTKKVIEVHLSHLEGENQINELIMFPDEYSRFVKLVTLLFDSGKMPKGGESFDFNGISGVSIKYSFYKLHKEIYKTSRIQDEVLKFMLHYINPLKGYTFKTLKSKFSEKPKRFPF